VVDKDESVPGLKDLQVVSEIGILFSPSIITEAFGFKYQM